MENLIELSTNKLLEKFGAGKHKPGSGSAAAFQGLLSAQLIRTVIDLSKSRIAYKKWRSSFENMEQELEMRIYPTLANLFQLDSEQFHRVIELRNALKATINPVTKRDLKQELDDALLPATQTPIAIAKLCVELAEFGIFLFDNGFQSARGDSGVALNNAIGTITGCLSIINLNLLSLGHNEETEQIRLEITQLKLASDDLSNKANHRMLLLEQEAERNKRYHQQLQELASGRWIGKKMSYEEIEQLARKIQNTLWLYRDKFVKQEIEDVIELLSPQIVLTKILGYQYEEPDTLGQYFENGQYFEIAGLINNPTKSIAVSSQFAKETRNFTAAHELGHALMHSQPVLHRDRPLDNPGTDYVRDSMEIEADKFATCFLMPSKQVERLFKQLFHTNKFVIDEDTVFGLTGGKISSFNQKCKSLRDLSKILASAESFAGVSFVSISEIFNVSKEAMAIRLEELSLVDF